MKLAELDPRAAPDALTASQAPHLIGVRHHSAALAAVMPTLLEAFAPTRVLIELPADLGAWLPWLGAPDLEAPVALSATGPGGLAFYPFADFSPELVAIRWALGRGVPVEAIDRPVAARAVVELATPYESALPDSGSFTAHDWDTLVEARAPAEPEALRRAALAFGWLLRAEALRGGGVRLEDRLREAHMRRCVRRALAEPGARVCAIIGAFHANALLETPLLEAPPMSDEEDALAERSCEPGPSKPTETSDSQSDLLISADREASPVGAMVPYDFELLDARSGYPAGIEDPRLVQLAYECFRRGVGLEEVLPQLLVEIARELRARRHVASFADLTEAARMAHDLAALRGQRGPSRRELLEAVGCAMAQGEPLGRGRVLARALEVVLVGHRRGSLPAAAPRSGLVVATEALAAELRLPGPRDKDGKDLTLDPHRSELDRRRLVFLGQLGACDVAYTEALGGGLTGARAQVATLTTRARVRWTAQTSAHLELGGMYGATPEAAATGRLRRALARLGDGEENTAQAWLGLFTRAVEAGLEALVSELLARLPELFTASASVPQLTQALFVCARLAERQLPTMTGDSVTADAATAREALELAALAASMGLLGSDNDDDVRALAELIGLLGGRDLASLRHTLSTFAAEGSPLMRGAGHAAGALIAQDAALASADDAPEEDASEPSNDAPEEDASAHTPASTDDAPEEDASEPSNDALGPDASLRFFTTFVSWFEHGLDGDVTASTERAGLIRGALLLSGASFEGDPRFITAVLEGIDSLTDERFLARLPSLRAGFDVLSTAARARLLEALGAPLTSLELDLDPEELEALAHADRAGLAALEALDLSPTEPHPAEATHRTRAVTPDDSALSATRSEMPNPPIPPKQIGLHDRLRLMLGRSRECRAPLVTRYGIALDELYGGHGEESRAGTDSEYPTAREWGDELAQLFGERVREEVLGRAAAAGESAALTLLDPEQVTPSIGLLEQILSLKGGLSEAELQPLKRLAQRVVDALVQELSTQTRPALVGLATPRATRRPTGPLDLRRTVRANLDSAHVHEGAVRLLPRHFVFRTRAKQSLDWHLVLVVDVSGSMEPSVIHAAMMAGILGALPAVTTHFITVNDRVVDLSDHVKDPLELLLSVRIGGGTLLAKGLRYARDLLRVPQRSIIVMVSDFEEGGPVSALVAEVRALVEGGSTLLGLAALGEKQAPRYGAAIASQLVAAGMPIAALSPLELAGWVRDVIRGGNR
ncbi:MAG: VWA domain-containing protein [Polyangiaceae bacterium]|nr:VWA domain-containing protein [Polyangiaceae bacterium]